MLRFLRTLYGQVLLAILLGILVGAFWPGAAVTLKPLGDGFVKLIKMVIAPVIFCTVAAGIAGANDLKALGRVGIRTLLYFEAVSTLALLIGFAVGRIAQPGRGFNVDPHLLDPTIAAGYAAKAAEGGGLSEHFLAAIPDSFVGAFTEGNLLQVLLLAILAGIACGRLGSLGERATMVLENCSKVLFSIIKVITSLAPIGAFGAMAFTIGKFGAGSLIHLGALIATFYVSSVLFVVIVLGAIAKFNRFSIFRFLRYISEELLIILGTSSSESVLPQLMEKLYRLGAGKRTVSLVIPTGYSFNLDGTNIYMTLATLFLAQATNTPLSTGQEITILGVAMLTSKGASGVTGAGFITLAATLSVIPGIPVVALALLVGIDRFMSECRALTNCIGNGVAALVIARWENDLDQAVLQYELRNPA